MIHVIDLEYRGTPGAVAVYLILTQDGPLIVETGPGLTTDALTGGLARHGLKPEDVRHALVTHIHFDHAGAAGWMAAHGATVHVHEFGARHLIDPSRLVESARRIYRDRMDELWGEIIPIPASQVVPVHDGDVLEFGGLTFRAIETPGHARHHLTFGVRHGGRSVAFTGDAAGTHIAASPTYMSIPIPPPEFQLGAWLASLGRLERERFDRLYPTHFGAVDDVGPHLARVRTALREHAARIGRMMADGVDEGEIRRRYCAWFAEEAETAGVPADQLGFYVKDTIADMNVTGIMRYWRKTAGVA